MEVLPFVTSHDIEMVVFRKIFRILRIGVQ